MNNYHNFIHELVVDLKELSYLCSQVRKNTIMTTIDLRMMLAQEIQNIPDSEQMLMKAINYVRSLTKHKDVTLTGDALRLWNRTAELAALTAGWDGAQALPGALLHARFGVESDAQACLQEHREVVRAVAHGDGLRQVHLFGLRDELQQIRLPMDGFRIRVAFPAADPGQAALHGVARKTAVADPRIFAVFHVQAKAAHFRDHVARMRRRNHFVCGTRQNIGWKIE